MFKYKFQYKQILAYSTVLLAILTSLINLSFTAPLVLAQTTEDLIEARPGNTIEFNVVYKNEGDDELMSNALLKIGIGSELEVLPNSITDSFDGSGPFVVTPTSVRPGTTWATEINYRPLSATATNTGLTTPGDVNMPLAIANKEGVLTFRARLKSDVLSRYRVGDILSYTPTKAEGLYSVLQFSGQGTIEDYSSIKIIAPLAQSSSVSVSSSTPRQSSSAAPAPLPQQVTVLPRTGGLAWTLVSAILATIILFLIYGNTRKTKMKVGKGSRVKG